MPTTPIHLLQLTNAKVIRIGLNNAERVGVAHAALPALNDNDRLTLIEDTQGDSVGKTPLDAAIHILLPVDLAKVRLGFGEEEWIHATVKMGVSRGGGISSDGDDGADRAVFGDEASRLAGGREHKDGSSIQIEGSPDCGHGARLNDRHWPLDKSAQLLEVAHVWDGVLSLEAGLAHLTNSLIWVGTLGRFTRELIVLLAKDL